MNRFALPCGVFAFAAASIFANPNLLDSTWDANGALGLGDQQFITDTPGATYDLTFDYTAYGSIPPTLYVFWSYNTSAVTQPFAGLSQDGTHTVTVDGLTGTGLDELYLNVEGNAPPTPSGITLSDFSLVEVNPNGNGVPDAATTPTLLGVSLLGLAALRRRLT